MEDSLIGQNPRDSLILLRNKNAALEKERNIRADAEKAKGEYSRILSLFSMQFLRDDVFTSLSELEKKELDKLCVSFCRRHMFANSLPFLSSLGYISYLGFFDWPFFLLVFPWAVFSFLALVGMEHYCEKKNKVFFLNQIDFLLLRRKIKKAEKLANKSPNT